MFILKQYKQKGAYYNRMEHTQVSCFEYDEETFKDILGFLPDTAAVFKELLDMELRKDQMLRVPFRNIKTIN